MNLSLALWLTQDAVVNGAVYALLALALIVVYTVTRVIFVPQGEFISFAALSLATLQNGKVPGTVHLLIATGLVVAVLDGWRMAKTRDFSRLPRLVLFNIALPLAVAALAWWSASRPTDVWLQVLVTLGIVIPFGSMIYRLAYQPLASASILVLLIVSVAVHYMMVGLGLVFFGGEGLRASIFPGFNFDVGILTISLQSIGIVLSSVVLMVVLWLYFGYTVYGKALRATAMNRIGSRLVGISTEFSGKLSFTLAALIGAISGILIAPITTVYYDTGFLIALKGFVGAIIGGMGSYPIAAVGSLLVGFLESYSSFWASSFKESIIFTLIIPVLLWRSLGKHRIEEEEEE
ncbi:MAG: branched-chain amino acid ABC transporter permease [Xanthobacteraceae bacterium]|nr:MAG: branched-chain amino acid ABC transporter permease [Xanthobacteraceae bacterium]